jgi:hypothetical protein
MPRQMQGTTIAANMDMAAALRPPRFGPFRFANIVPHFLLGTQVSAL